MTERHQLVPPLCAQAGIKPTTLLVYKTVLQPANRPGQGSPFQETFFLPAYNLCLKEAHPLLTCAFSLGGTAPSLAPGNAGQHSDLGPFKTVKSAPPSPLPKAQKCKKGRTTWATTRRNLFTIRGGDQRAEGCLRASGRSVGVGGSNCPPLCCPQTTYHEDRFGGPK